MRVLAREGETTWLNNGVITVDGVNIDQPYLHIKNAVHTSQLNKKLESP